MFYGVDCAVILTLCELEQGRCFMLFSIVSYLYVSFSGLISSVWEEKERANFTAIVYL